MAEGRIPQSFIDEVLLRTDIVDLIDARVKLKRAGKNYSACCPFHQEKSPSFTVNRDKQFYYCFGCGATGNALSFLMAYDRLEFIDGLKLLAQQAGLSLPETRDASSEKPSQQPLFDALEAAAVFFEQQLRSSPQKSRAIHYLKARGLQGPTAKQFRIGYAPPGWDNLLRHLGQAPEQRQRLLDAGLLIHNSQRQSDYDAMRDRVIFPIRDYRGRVIGFGGRVLNDDKPKYLNSPESPVFHKGQELYGLYEARQHGKLQQIVVVEGYMDVVSLAQAGISECVATLGTATSSTHVERLFRLVPEVIFCFDGDAAGRRAAWRALENTLPALRDGCSVRFLFLPDGEDPDSIVRREGPERFRARLKADALTLSDYFFQHLGADLALNTLEGRAQLATLALPYLTLIDAGLFRELLLQELSRLTALSLELLQQRLLNTAPVTPAAPSMAAATDTPGSSSSAQTIAPQRQPNSRASTFTPSAPRPPLPPANATLRTLSAQAILRLLQAPELAQQWPAEWLSSLDDPESALLCALATALREQPQRSLAALIGSWQGQDHGRELACIASQGESLVPAQRLQDDRIEFSKRLHYRHLENRLAQAAQAAKSEPSLHTLQALTEARKALAQAQEKPS